MPNILLVGNATLDIINVVDEFPAEDDEVRAESQHVALGGNAANSAVVLHQLGHHCAWAGILADEADGRRILEELHRRGIDTSAGHVAPHGKVPTSYVILNRRNGSRTIVHYRDLPEYHHEQFSRIELERYHWIHFEGRNVAEVQRMMARAKHRRPDLPCSLEVEKPRTGIEKLFPFADLLLFSRVYAHTFGERKPRPFLERMRRHAPEADLVCGWGDQGAHALTRDGRYLSSPAFPPALVVDTLGAGDVFNAGIIDRRLRGHGLDVALIEAARLAGHKCGRYGLDDLVR